MVVMAPGVEGNAPQAKFLVNVRLRLCDGQELPLLAQIDTGEEANLVKNGVVPGNISNVVEGVCIL